MHAMIPFDKRMKNGMYFFLLYAKTFIVQFTDFMLEFVQKIIIRMIFARSLSSLVN